MKKYPKVPEIQLLDHNPDALLQVQHLVLLGPLRTVDQGRQNRLRCFPFRKVAREDGVLDFFFFVLSFQVTLITSAVPTLNGKTLMGQPNTFKSHQVFIIELRHIF